MRSRMRGAWAGVVAFAVCAVTAVALAGSGAKPVTDPAPPPVKPVPEVEPATPAPEVPATPATSTPPAAQPAPAPSQHDAPRQAEPAPTPAPRDEPARRDEPAPRDAPRPREAQPRETPRPVEPETPATPQLETKRAGVTRTARPRAGRPSTPAPGSALLHDPPPPPQTAPRAGVPAPGLPVQPSDGSVSPPARGAVPVERPRPKNPPQLTPPHGVRVVCPNPILGFPLLPPLMLCEGVVAVDEEHVGCADLALVPGVVLYERYQSEGQKPEDVDYLVTEDAARIEHARGHVLLDFVADRLATYDADEGTWRVEALSGFEAAIDSAVAVARERMSKRGQGELPAFELVPGQTMIAGYWCEQYHVFTTHEPFPGEVEDVEMQIWVTRHLGLPEGGLEVYQRMMRCFDQMWLDAPIERPVGVTLRTEVRHRPSGGTGEWEKETAEVRKVEWRCLPPESFIAPEDGRADAERR